MSWALNGLLEYSIQSENFMAVLVVLRVRIVLICSIEDVNIPEKIVIVRSTLFLKERIH